MDEEEGEEVAAHSKPLFLPSGALARHVVCSRRLVRTEFQLRLAQAQATLNELRGVLLHRSRLLQSKAKYASGTEHMTRSNKLIQDVYARANNLSKKYNHIRGALVVLGSELKETRWADVYLPLTDADVKGPTSMDTEMWGEGHKTLTWIWKVQGVGSNMDDGIVNASEYVSQSSAHMSDQNISPSGRMVSNAGTESSLARGVYVTLGRDTTRDPVF